MYLLLIYFFHTGGAVGGDAADHKVGDRVPYRTVLYGTIGTAVAIVAVFMAASMSGQGVFAQISGMIENVASELAKNPVVAETLGMASVTGPRGSRH